MSGRREDHGRELRLSEALEPLAGSHPHTSLAILERQGTHQRPTRKRHSGPVQRWLRVRTHRGVARGSRERDVLETRGGVHHPRAAAAVEQQPPRFVEPAAAGAGGVAIPEASASHVRPSVFDAAQIDPSGVWRRIPTPLPEGSSDDARHSNRFPARDSTKTPLVVAAQTAPSRSTRRSEVNPPG